MQKVLVVDDTKNIRLLLTKCLTLEGYKVVTASDGKEALELFQKEHFDLAFLDIKLPEVRGTEVLKRIREMGIQTPVIIITAYATVKNAVDCTHMGAVAYVQKPFTAEKIRSVLTEFNSRRQKSEDCEVGPLKGNDFIKQLLDEGSYEKALQLLKRAISEDPTDAELFLLMSQAYKGLGNGAYAEKLNWSYKLLSGSAGDTL